MQHSGKVTLLGFDLFIRWLCRIFSLTQALNDFQIILFLFAFHTAAPLFFGIGLVYAAAPTPLAPKARQNPESCDHIGLVQTKKVDRESSSMLCFVDGGQRLLSKKYRRLMDWFERVVLAPALSHRRRRPI